MFIHRHHAYYVDLLFGECKIRHLYIYHQWDLVVKLSKTTALTLIKIKIL